MRFLLKNGVGGERRIFRKTAVLTSEIFLVNVKIVWAFGIKKAPPDFSDGMMVHLRKRASTSAAAGIFLSFNLATADEQDERSHVPVGRFQSFNVFRAEYRGNDVIRGPLLSSATSMRDLLFWCFC